MYHALDIRTTFCEFDSYTYTHSKRYANAVANSVSDTIDCV